MTNLQEFLAGTDPLDPQSCLRLFVELLPGTGNLQLSFVAVAGVDYTVQYADDLASGLWHSTSLATSGANPATAAWGSSLPAQSSSSPTTLIR